jgi:predicted nucleic acid-binding protein
VLGCLLNAITLDAGALIAIDRNNRRVLAMLARSRESGTRVSIPATALAQAVRDPRRQARLMKLARQAETDIIPLDDDDAVAVGRILAATGTADLADAHVVLCAWRASRRIMTSDPRDLAAIDQTLTLIPV